jgi:hypothetical protein
VIQVSPSGKIFVAACACGRTQTYSNWTALKSEEVLSFLERCGWQVERRDVLEETICVCPFCLADDGEYSEIRYDR